MIFYCKYVPNIAWISCFVIVVGLFFFFLNLATLPIDTSIVRNKNRSARYHFIASNMEALEIMEEVRR